MDISHLEVPEGAVILVRDPLNELSDDAAFFDFVKQLHEKFPQSLVVTTSDMTFETLSEDELESLLTDLLAHRRARG